MNRLAALVLLALGAQAPAVLAAEADPVADRAQALLASDGFGCYAVAAGRASLPVRENYFTYSPVVDTVTRGTVFIGQRVVGENKVLVFTPHAEGPVGIARFTFAAVVPAERCVGDALYQPRYDALRQWVPPLPGEPEAPQPAAAPMSSWGCFEGTRALRLSAETLPEGQLFFAARTEVDGRYSGALAVLDGTTGAPLGEVPARHTTLVAVSRCGGEAAHRQAE